VRHAGLRAAFARAVSVLDVDQARSWLPVARPQKTCLYWVASWLRVRGDGSAAGRESAFKRPAASLSKSRWAMNPAIGLPRGQPPRQQSAGTCRGDFARSQVIGW